jgi:signal transduction histidine kinase
MAEILHFRVSSGLKNIIGRELINDKYIAIFELVKNSYDAGSSYAKISFNDLDSTEATITISDDGKGMSKKDIIEKWLFVAYSEKRYPSYRDSIKRAVAGAKGVGRFSCDRLGEFVRLSSKISSEEIRHEISISWSDFEKNSLDNFADIDVHYEFCLQQDSACGTSIKISNLREKWARSDLLALKKALAQLVNPSATSSYDPFEIILEVPSELEEDNKHREEREKVNGTINNDVFDVINQKTTKISVQISEDGSTIRTTLNDRGSFLFETKEKNEYTLSDITCTLYFLNQAAKLNFTRKMGVEAVNYGSVFVYKNGFRVFPFGEPGRDFFDIDQRKQQGYKRFLGTRELVGQLEINGDKNDLVETSSRNNGFIATPQLEELKSFFMEYVLKPLEKYVTQIVQWGATDDLFDESVDANLFENIEQIIKKIKTRTKAEAYISINCNQALAETINQRRIQNQSPAEQLRKMAAATQDDDFIKKADQVVRHTKELQKRANLAAQEAEAAQEQLDEAHAELTTTKKQIGLLTARADLTAQDAIDAMHIMKGYADAIDSNILEVYELASEENMDISLLRPIFDGISQICKKIMNSYNLVMRTGYSADSDTAHEDLVPFVVKYCTEFNRTLNVTVENPANIVANVKFNPLEFSIVLDNLIDNSRKANANQLMLSFGENDKEIILRCRDDGYGLKKGANEEKLFEPGYTTTTGSGIGLSTAKKYIEKSGGRITYNREYTQGFEVVLYLAKWI